MDSNKAQLIQDDIATLLSVLETKYNVRLEVATGKFYKDKFVPKISFLDVLNVDSNVENMVKSNKLGYEFNIVGRKVMYINEICEIVDIKLRNTKYPIIVIDSKGKEQSIEKISADMII